MGMLTLGIEKAKEIELDYLTMKRQNWACPLISTVRNSLGIVYG